MGLFSNKKALEAENQQLKKELEAFHTIQKELREELLFLELNASGGITACNRGFEKLTHYGMQDLEAKGMAVLLHEDYISTQDGKGLLSAVKSRAHWHGKVRIVGAKGDEHWLRAILHPIDNANGQVERIVLYMAEQTTEINSSREQHDMMAALNRSTAVIEFDLSGTILKANENFLKAMGYQAAQIIGKHHSMFCQRDYTDSAEYKEFWRNLASGEMFSGRYQRIDSNGREVWLEASYNPIRDENRKLYKVVKFATVITDQMQREQAIADAANVAFNTSTKTGEQAEKGSGVVKKTLEIMQGLSSQMGLASQGIKELDEQSQKVADLVKSISGIADQTNLLALNAAIEAARAGDQGRGFAVVADEVRQLASRTSSATEEIVSVVTENRKLTENAVQLIETSQARARDALDYSNESGEVMNEIQRGSNEVVQAIGHFAQRL